MSDRTPKFNPNHIAPNVLKEKTANSVTSSLTKPAAHHASANASAKLKSQLRLAANAENEYLSLLSNKVSTTTASSGTKSRAAPHQSHLSSHLNCNLSTPTNRNTKSLLTNTSIGSNKIQSDKKKSGQSSATKSVDTRGVLHSSTTKSTPVARSAVAYNPASRSATISKAANEQQPELPTVWDNVDYSEIMSKKSEYGYKGAGYICEFDCDPKYLKGIQIPYGLWRITSNEKKDTPSLFGPMIMYRRIDADKQKTPSKEQLAKNLARFDFSWKPYVLNSSEKATHNTTSTNLTADCLHLETKQTKTRKNLRWADNLESIEEVRLSSQMPCDTLPLAPIDPNATPTNPHKAAATNALTSIKGIDITQKKNNNSSFDYNGSPYNTSMNTAPLKNLNMRRSFSLGDIDNFILNLEDDTATTAAAAPTAAAVTTTGAEHVALSISNPSAHTVAPASALSRFDDLVPPPLAIATSSLNVTYDKEAAADEMHTPIKSQPIREENDLQLRELAHQLQLQLPPSLVLSSTLSSEHVTGLDDSLSFPSSSAAAEAKTPTLLQACSDCDSSGSSSRRTSLEQRTHQVYMINFDNLCVASRNLLSQIDNEPLMNKLFSESGDIETATNSAAAAAASASANGIKVKPTDAQVFAELMQIADKLVSRFQTLKQKVVLTTQ